MAGDRLRTHLTIIIEEYAWHTGCYFVKFKSVIFLKRNLEAISSNFISAIISSHTVYIIYLSKYAIKSKQTKIKLMQFKTLQ